MTTSDGYRFGISQFTTTPWTFTRDLERYAAHGADAIEICEFKLGHDEYGPQLARVGECGLTVSSVQTTVHSLFADSLAPTPVDPGDRLRHISDSISRIAPHVPANTPFVVITGAAPAGDCERVYQWSLQALPQLAEVASAFGMRVAFEPLNPVLLNTDTALWGLDRALELIDAVGHPSLGLCCDAWNVFETANLHDVIRECGKRIFLVQVSDWCRPRSHVDRRSLGDGTIDLAGFLSSVRRAGYDRPYVLEMFSSESLPDSLWKADMDEVIDKNIAAFERLWAASEVPA